MVSNNGRISSCVAYQRYIVAKIVLIMVLYFAEPRRLYRWSAKHILRPPGADDIINISSAMPDSVAG